jgi:hypothetical protein
MKGGAGCEFDHTVKKGARIPRKRQFLWWWILWRLHPSVPWLSYSGVCVLHGNSALVG